MPADPCHAFPAGAGPCLRCLSPGLTVRAQRLDACRTGPLRTSPRRAKPALPRLAGRSLSLPEIARTSPSLTLALIIRDTPAKPSLYLRSLNDATPASPFRAIRVRPFLAEPVHT